MYNNIYKDIIKSTLNKCDYCNKYYNKSIIVNCSIMCNNCYLKKYGHETKFLV